MYKTQVRDSSTLCAVCHCYACDELLGKARVSHSRIVMLFFVIHAQKLYSL